MDLMKRGRLHEEGIPRAYSPKRVQQMLAEGMSERFIPQLAKEKLKGDTPTTSVTANALMQLVSKTSREHSFPDGFENTMLQTSLLPSATKQQYSSSTSSRSAWRKQGRDHLVDIIRTKEVNIRARMEDLSAEDD
uniref:Uncharacterized protein n=1 Tax=Romanomermis culicivorax TaxID=13658 RepID=A0A915J1Z2_ROMCU